MTRKTLLIIAVNLVVVLTLGGFLLKFFLRSKPHLADWDDMEYKLGDKKYHLLVADSQSKYMNGLMNFRELKDFDGMIFIFPTKGYRAFWNQNTYLDLQIYWLNNDMVIGTEKLPSIEKTKIVKTIYSPGPADKVIELVIK